MCNDFGNRVPYDEYLRAFSEIRVPLRWPTATREYLSVGLDDPLPTQPLNCALVEQGESEGFILVWSREARKAKAE